jgi:hypothetical protein
MIALTVAAASARLVTSRRLADIAPRERSLRHHADEPAVVIDDRHELELAASHREPDLADRLAVDGGRESRLHDVPRPPHDVGQERGLRGAAVEPHRL